jgi:hypothetical protein
VIQGAGYRGGE